MMGFLQENLADPVGASSSTTGDETVKIKTKFISVFAVAIVASGAVNLFVLVGSVYPSFVTLERAEATENADRVLAAVMDEVNTLDVTATDYANWDDSYQYATDGNATFIERNFTPSSVRNLNINIIHIETASGQALYDGDFDAAGNSVSPPDRLLLSAIDMDHILTPSGIAHAPVKGVTATPRGPMLVVSRPILKSSGDGPAAGVIVMGRLLDGELVSALRARTRVEFRLVDLARARLDPADSRIVETLSRSMATPVIREDGETMTAHSLLLDVRGIPELLVSVSTPREISRLGQESLIYAMSGGTLSALTIMAILWAALQWTVISPLAALTEGVVAIGRHGCVTGRVGMARTDELGILSCEFDTLMETLADLRNRLIEQSYHAGVAEMASGVMHNLRNQLMPLTLRVTRLCGDEHFGPSDLSQLDQATDLLAGGRFMAEQKDKAAEFIKLSAHDLNCRLIQLRAELAMMVDDTLRIGKVVDELEGFSRVICGMEPTRLTRPIRDAILIAPKFPEMKVDVALDPGLECCPEVMTRSFLLKHLIVNLLVNACEAVLAAGRTDDTIVIRADMTDVHGRMFVDLQVHDHGIGIEPDAIALVFARGYTSKVGPKRGTGLHWCANCVAAMGGQIFAESPGLNSGATFHILLPVA